MAAELKKCEIELKSIKQGKELIEKETEELRIELETERKSIKSMCEFCNRSEGTKNPHTNYKLQGQGNPSRIEQDT